MKENAKYYNDLFYGLSCAIAVEIIFKIPI